MSFLATEMLWALVLVPALVAAYVIAQRRRRKYALRYASLSMVKDALGRGPGIRRHIPPALFIAGITASIIALARPVATVTLPSQQSTVILTLDVSGSMRAEDMKPSRMEAAKAAARAFVEKQPRNVRIGVVSFSNNASVVQAPSTDHETVVAAINRLATQRATAIGTGILTSLDAIFEQPTGTPTAGSRDSPVLGEPTPTPTPSQRGGYAPAVVVLLSDGQSNAGVLPLEAAKEAANRGVRVHTIGVGSPQGTVLGVEGRSVRVRLDEDTLRQIASKTDGSYFRADNETDLREIYENLSSQLIFKAEQTEITAGFSGLATVFLVAAGALSLAWFSRLP